MSQATTGTSVAVAAPTLQIFEGHVTTTSNQIAEHFGKQHKDVLRAIRNLRNTVDADFYQRNFALIQIVTDLGIGRTRQDPAYRITRDGFVFLAMGFTGKEAATWKVAYLTAFNRMEAELLQPDQDPKRIEHARQLAHAATAQVYQAVFDAALNSDSSPYNIRLLLGFTGITAPMPYVQALENGAFAMTLPQLTKAIRTDLMVPDTALANLAAACTQRMAEQAEVQERNAALVAKRAAAADKPQRPDTFKAVLR